MRETLKSIFFLTVATILLVAAPMDVHAQGAALSGLLGNATDLNFFWTQSGSPYGDLRPENNKGAAGLGFELSFGIPGGIPRTRRPPAKPNLDVKGNTCEARFQRRKLDRRVPCSDTSWIAVKRDSTSSGMTFEQQVKIDKFDWTEPALTFEVAIGFAQTGAFISRRNENDIRVSLREAPSVALYANYEPDLPILSALPLNLGGYFGARSGLVSLNGGRAYTDSTTTKFTGETFQIGPVAGIVMELGGINFFGEGSFMWRDFKSVEWDRTTGLGTLPRRMDLSGVSIAFGMQFELKSEADKK